MPSARYPLRFVLRLRRGSPINWVGVAERSSGEVGGRWFDGPWVGMVTVAPLSMAWGTAASYTRTPTVSTSRWSGLTSTRPAECGSGPSPSIGGGGSYGRNPNPGRRCCPGHRQCPRSRTKRTIKPADPYLRRFEITSSTTNTISIMVVRTAVTSRGCTTDERPTGRCCYLRPGDRVSADRGRFSAGRL